MKISFAPGFEESMNRAFSNKFRYLLPRWWSELRWEIRAAWRRVFRGWDDSFLWGHHHEHSRMMVGMLNVFIESHCGHPGNLTLLEWDGILMQIRDGFQAAMDLDNAPWSGPEHDSLEDIMNNGLDLYKKYYLNLWD